MGTIAPLSIKSMRREFRDKGVFYTPPAMALYLKSLIPNNPTEVYDPTCGRGSLLAVFDDNVQKYGQDINPIEVEIASQTLQNFHGVVADTLTSPAFLNKKFNCIVANPPFSVKWQSTQDDPRFQNAPTVPTNSRADYAFLMHITHYLSDTGIAVVINSPGILYRGNREATLRKWFVEQNWIEKVIHLKGGQFEDTNISTCCLVLRKNKTTTDIEFIDTEHEQSRLVGIDEIRQNNFTLSVSNYLQPPQAEQEELDILQIRTQLNTTILRNLRADLEMLRLLTSSDFIPYGNLPLQMLIDFLNELQSMIDEYRPHTS